MHELAVSQESDKHKVGLCKTYFLNTGKVVLKHAWHAENNILSLGPHVAMQKTLVD